MKVFYLLQLIFFLLIQISCKNDTIEKSDDVKIENVFNISGNSELKLGDSSNLVTRLNDYLSQKGYLLVDDSTSKFSSETEQALKLFQLTNKLKATGKFDSSTIYHINSSEKEIIGLSKFFVDTFKSQSLSDKYGVDWELIPSHGFHNDITTYSDDLTYCVEGNTKVAKWNVATKKWERLVGEGGRVSTSQDNLWCVFGKKIYKWNVNKWINIPGAAYDVGVGTGNNVWIVGDDLNPYKWDGSKFNRMPGAALRITVDDNNTPWIVGHDKNVYKWEGNKWKFFRAGAMDIGSGGGNTWIVGDNWGIYYLENEKWVRVKGRAKAIDVNSSGLPWIIEPQSKIYKRKK